MSGSTLDEFFHGGERFEWDSVKADLNVANHGVTFEEAATAFADDYQLAMFDEAHSDQESRSLLLGQSVSGRVLLIVWTLRGDSIRIISARFATGCERRQYEGHD